jgi:glyoxylase-like metal-dependent hydrolase (beta-lactamase superfamily II)
VSVRVERVITSGIFSLDGDDFEVDNNIWLVGDDEEVLVVDAAHQAEPIIEAVAGRRVVAIVATHGHNDHINAAVELADAVSGPILLHPDDAMLWEVVHSGRPVDGTLTDGQELTVGGATLTVLHTPGHSPGGCCLHLAADGVLFSGDTLFNGGPGATGRSFSDRSILVRSIAARLLPLPGDTVVHTGHGDDTTIGAEAPGVQAALADIG